MYDRSDKFAASDVTVWKPQCHFCERYIKGTLTCVAFDRLIPQSILHNEVDHFHEHVAGDAGLLGRSTIGRYPVLRDLIVTLATVHTPEKVAEDWAESFNPDPESHG